MIEVIYYPTIKKYVVIVNSDEFYYPVNKAAMKKVVTALEGHHNTTATMKVSGE